MVGLFCDSFDYYIASGNVESLLAAGRYNSISGNIVADKDGAGSAPVPRTGSICIGLSGVPTRLEWLTSSNPDTLAVGTAYWWDGAAAESQFFSAGYNGGSGITEHFGLLYMTDNSIQVRHGDATVLGTSSVSVVARQNWNFIEVKGTIHDTTGSIDVYVDGISVISLSGIDTRNASSAIWNSVVWVKGESENWLDDIYINDTTGTENNDVLGDVRVYTLDVDGAGSFAQFSPSAGSNYENVDEDEVDDDTTYNSDSVSNQKDLFTIENLPVNVTVVHFVENVTYGRREEGGSAQLYLKTELSGVEQDSGAKTFPTTYAFRSEVFDTDPNSAAWTPTKVDDSEIGYEIV